MFNIYYNLLYCTNCNFEIIMQNKQIYAFSLKFTLIFFISNNNILYLSNLYALYIYFYFAFRNRRAIEYDWFMI